LEFGVVLKYPEYHFEGRAGISGIEGTSSYVLTAFVPGAMSNKAIETKMALEIKPLIIIIIIFSTIIFIYC
jgi:hypothetical protein